MQKKPKEVERRYVAEPENRVGLRERLEFCGQEFWAGIGVITLHESRETTTVDIKPVFGVRVFGVREYLGSVQKLSPVVPNYALSYCGTLIQRLSMFCESCDLGIECFASSLVLSYGGSVIGGKQDW